MALQEGGSLVSLPDGGTLECNTTGALTGINVCTPAPVTGAALITSLVLDVLLGLLCYIGFVLWRGSFGIYHCRDYLVPAESRPPALKLGGHWQLWSWMMPVWQVSDNDYLR